MAKKVVIFKDRFGGEHQTEEDADRASSVEGAKRAFEEAARNLSKLFLVHSQTADGQLITSCGSYYHVARRIQGRPWKSRVWVWPHDAVVGEGPGGEIIYRNTMRDGKNVERVEVRVSELYASEAEAEKRYRELFAEYVAEVTREFGEMTA